MVFGSSSLGADIATTSFEELRKSAYALRAAGSIHEAATAFVQLAQARPDDWLTQYNAGAVCVEANRLADALLLLERSLALQPGLEAWKLCAHVRALRGDIAGARQAFAAASAIAPRDFGAHWGLFEVLQLLDDNAAALQHQRLALQERTLITIEATAGPARRTLLELCVAGTFQANIPLDFILDPLHTTVHKLYLGEHPVRDVPAYDLVFNAIAEAAHAGPALAAAAAFIAAQDRPALNAPALVPLTARDCIAALFAQSTSVHVAPTQCIERARAPMVMPFPYLIRPRDSHAGNDLAKIECASELATYLAATPQPAEFYVTSFIDYRSGDGYYRKYRIIFIDGVPYPVHLAISPRWMIHYYNAPMAEHAWMRAEEQAFLREMESVFVGPARSALDEIARMIPLDYFGIDCGLGSDGRLILFEASTAMIVHMRDPVDLYPYKAAAVSRVTHALEQLFDARLARASRDA